ncbi:hypothetical protein F2Q68_00008002 [Brassica cretica]|uniref:Uncharacterized protein n=1 Tax=Brassica cretica TaxID=69181 RepID=A0A8S9KP65_BRACR|nr:hypothetical protein F2Q68_00008002 [Brassica cretica]
MNNGTHYEICWIHVWSKKVNATRNFLSLGRFPKRSPSATVPVIPAAHRRRLLNYLSSPSPLRQMKKKKKPKKSSPSKSSPNKSPPAKSNPSYSTEKDLDLLSDAIVSDAQIGHTADTVAQQSSEVTDLAITFDSTSLVETMIVDSSADPSPATLEAQSGLSLSSSGSPPSSSPVTDLERTVIVDVPTDPSSNHIVDPSIIPELSSVSPSSSSAIVSEIIEVSLGKVASLDSAIVANAEAKIDPLGSHLAVVPDVTTVPPVVVEPSSVIGVEDVNPPPSLEATQHKKEDKQKWIEVDPKLTLPAQAETHSDVSREAQLVQIQSSRSVASPEIVQTMQIVPVF